MTDDPRNGVVPTVAGASDLLDPVVNRLMGPHINRRTLDNIGKSGLVVVET